MKGLPKGVAGPKKVGIISSGLRRERPGPYSKPNVQVAKGDHELPDEGRMVYVGGLPFSAEWQELKDHMKQAGNVEFASVLANEWGGSRGVGMVRYATPEEAQNAVDILNGSLMHGRPLLIDLWEGAKPKTVKGSLGCGGAGTGKGSMKGGKAVRGKGTMMMPANKPGMMWMLVPATSSRKGGGSGCRGSTNNQISAATVHGDPQTMVYVGNLPKGVEWQELKDHMSQAGMVEFASIKGKSGQVRFSSVEEAQNAIELLNGTDWMGAVIMVDEWTTA